MKFERCTKFEDDSEDIYKDKLRRVKEKDSLEIHKLLNFIEFEKWVYDFGNKTKN